MSNEVDYYDVQSMIRDARAEIRGEITEAVYDAKRELWNDVQDELRSLREMVADLREQVADALVSGGTLG